MADGEALFAHLQELMDELPAMQQAGEKLAKARAAEAVIVKEHYWQGQKRELDGVLAALADAQRACEEAMASGDAEAEQTARARVLQHGSERGIRKGAEESARRDLEKVLAEGGFETVEDAHALQLPAEELASLAAKIEVYQHDYAETLAACQALEGPEGDE